MEKKKRKTFKEWFKGLSSWKRFLYISLVCILVLAIVAVTITYCYIQSLLDIMEPEEEKEVEIEVDEPDLSIEPIDGFINILLMGVDSRDMSTFEGTRTDMMIVASINTETNDVTMTSVYRDTFTKIGDTGTYQRMNTGMVYGGIKLAVKTINQSLDLNIDKYVVVNWGIVVEAVDLLGGIDVNIENYEIKEMNSCIVSGAHTLGKEAKLISSSGPQTIDGVQALAYGRMRYDVGSDTKRTERQRIIITKCVEKLKTMKIKDIKNFIFTIAPMVKTNLKLSDILTLGVNATKYNISTGDGWPYNYCFGHVNGMSLIFPTSLRSNVIDFHEKVFGQTDYVPSSKIDEISNRLEEYRLYGQDKVTASTPDPVIDETPSDNPDSMEETEKEPDSTGTETIENENSEDETEGETVTS